MKKTTKKVAFFAMIGCALLLSSCAGFNLSNNNDRAQTGVVLTQDNFQVVKRVSGEVSSHKLFGFIGGLSDSYLKHSAISNMYENAQLTGSQTIVDIHVVKSKALHVISLDERMIATGTVIEFTGPNTTNIKMQK